MLTDYRPVEIKDEAEAESAHSATPEEEPQAVDNDTTQPESEVQYDSPELPQPVGKGVFGEIYDSFKGRAKDAVRWLFGKKSGEAKNVFHREEVGDIGLIWGNDKGGLKHIIEKHIIEHSDYDSVEQLTSDIEDVVSNGDFIVQKGGNLRFEKDGHRVIVAKNQEGDFVVTAYDNSRSAQEKKRTEADATLFRQRVLDEMNGTPVSSSPGSEFKDSSSFAEKQASEENISVLSRIPVDEAGKPQFGAVDTDTAWDGLVEKYEGNEARAQGFAENMVRIKESALKKAEKVKSKATEDPDEWDAAERAREAAVEAARKELEHWRGVAGVSGRRVAEAEALRREAEAKEAAEAAERERLEQEDRRAVARGDKALREAYDEVKDYPEALDMLRDLSPRTMDEAAAFVLSTNKVLLSDDGVRRGARAEVGIGEHERKRLFPMFARRENGGQSLASLAEDKMQSVCEEYGIPYDVQTARDALIDMLHSSERPSDIRGYIRNRRIAEAREYAERMEDQIEAGAVAAFMEDVHLTPEEYEAWKEVAEAEAEEALRNLDEREYNSNIADEYARWQMVAEGAKERIGNETDRGDRGDESAGEGSPHGAVGEMVSGERVHSASRATEGIEDARRPEETRGALRGDGEPVSGEVSAGAADRAFAQRAGEGDIQRPELRQQDKLPLNEAEGLALSQETDHNDLPLLTASDGTTAFGAIRKEEGVQAGVIKLSLGFDRVVNVDGKDVHRGYGYEHIEAQRGEVIRAAGFKNVVEFVEYVSKNYTSIKKGGKRNGKDTFIIEMPQTNGTNTNVLYVELSADGEYWNVNSGGIFRADYTKNKEVVGKKEKTDNSLPALETSPATVDGKVQDTDEGGNLLSGNSSLSEFYERKVTDSASDKQEVGAESLLQTADNKGEQTVQSAVEVLVTTDDYRVLRQRSADGNESYLVQLSKSVSRSEWRIKAQLHGGDYNTDGYGSLVFSNKEDMEACLADKDTDIESLHSRLQTKIVEDGARRKAEWKASMLGKIKTMSTEDLRRNIELYDNAPDGRHDKDTEVIDAAREELKRREAADESDAAAKYSIVSAGAADRGREQERQVVYEAAKGLVESTGLPVVEVSDAEAVAVVEGREDARLMGSRTDRKMEQVSQYYADKELDENQRKVVDVFSGRSDNEVVEAERPDGNRRVVIRQGDENRAGTKHSLFRHFDTRSNSISAEDIARIPEVIANGERSVSGKRVTYDLEIEDGTRLRVTTKVNNRREEFTNLLSNRKPLQSELVKNTQLSARASDAEVSDAKVDNSDETAKFSIGTYHGTHADFDAFEHSDMGEGVRIMGNLRFLRDDEGVVYGWTVGGKVYLNRDAMNPETPLHEYTHLWDEMVQKENPELWARGKELLKQTPIWEEVLNDPNYADIRDNEDAVASEVHSRLTGRDGAERLQEMIDNSRKEGAIAVAEKVTLVERIRRWLSEMFKNLKATLSKWSKEELDELTLEDFNNMTLRDLAEGWIRVMEIRILLRSTISTRKNFGRFWT